MFDVSITVQVEDDDKTLFWSDHWMDDSFLGSLAPLVVVAVHPRMCKTRLVADGLQNACWIQDISDSLVPLAQYVTLWSKMQDVQLNGESDKFVWKRTSNQQYSAASAYGAFFYGQCGIAGAKELSKLWASPRSKFFLCLALLRWSWTSERL
jgi:hypothetical protein